jgi:hypothetical protein
MSEVDKANQQYIPQLPYPIQDTEKTLPYTQNEYRKSQRSLPNFHIHFINPRGEKNGPEGRRQAVDGSIEEGGRGVGEVREAGWEWE